MKLELKNKNVVVVGLGKSGLAAARLLVKCGARVTLTDQKTRAQAKDLIHQIPSRVRGKMGSKSIPLKNADLVVVSPGVPWSHPSLVVARKSGIPVWPELELGWRFVRPKTTIAITGTNGKTTVTALVGHILKSARRQVVVGGNIGTPLSALTDKITPKTILVLEVSSYQMEAHQTFHPNIGIFMNLTPDHLARHRTMQGYATAKQRLLKWMDKSDTVIFNSNDRWCRWIVKTSRAKKVPFPSTPLKLLASAISLRGGHNLENAMAASAACRAAGISQADIRKGLKSFKGVPHRIEVIGRKKGVLYVNDSKATNVDSTVVALKSFTEPLILLLGGEHKGTPYTPLRPFIKKRVRYLIAYGESQSIVEKDLKGSAPLLRVRDLKDAVRLASRLAKKGDAVLLSPACASFDQYKNFEERGEHFASLVRRFQK
jgi:UDP-N-acetylmuramoylalanine--D-glutamate ligase